MGRSIIGRRVEQGFGKRALGALLTTTAMSTAALVAGAIATASPAIAQQYWEAGANGDDTLDGGANGPGTWDVGTTPNWTDATDTALGPTTWTNGSAAVFGGASGGTVNVDNTPGNVTVSAMSFDATGDNTTYTITGDGLTIAAGGLTVSVANVTVPAGPDATIQSTIDGAQSLVTSGAGTLRLTGEIGGTAALASVTLGTTGGTQLAADVTTTGLQDYSGTALELTGTRVLESTGSGAITFGGTTGAANLTVNTGGTTTFGGTVNLTGSLATDAGGGTTVSGGGITTTVDQTYGDAVTVSGATTGFTGDDINFQSTLDGNSAVTVTAGGVATFGGVVGTTPLASLTSNGAGTTVINGGAVTTIGSQSYNGTTLGLDTTLATTNSSVSFTGTLDAAAAGVQSLTINNGNGTTSFGGAVGGGGATELEFLVANGTGAVTMNAGTVNTTGLQTYAGSLTLGTATTLTSSGSGAISLNGGATGANSLTINTTGTTNLGNDVGDSFNVASITTNATGTTVIAAGTVTTTGGAQTYNDDVTANNATTFTGSTLTFNEDLTGTGTLQFNATTTTFGDANTDTVNVGSITTDAAGTTTLEAGNVTTTGDQTYNDNVALTSSVVVTGVNVTFNEDLTGAFALDLQASGVSTFGSAADDVVNIASILTSAAGSTTINAGTVTTTGAQTYNDNVTIASTTTLTGAAISFVDFVDGDGGVDDLTITDSGTTTFSAAVGATTALASLTTTAGGATNINGGSVRTTGAQTYNDAVTLGAATTLTSTTSGGVNSTSTVDNNGNLLTVNTATAGTFSGIISDTGGLTKEGAGTLTLTANNSYTGATTINAGTLQIQGDAANIDSATTNNAGLDLNAGGDINSTLTTAGGSTTTVSGGAGTSFVTGLLTNGGTFTVTAGSALDATGGGFTNTGTVNNFGTITDAFNNSGTANNFAGATWNADVINTGTINNNGTWNQVTAAGILNNGTWTTTNVPAGGAGVVNGNFANNGTVNMVDGDTQDVATFNGTWSGNGNVNAELALTGGGVGGPSLGDMIVVTGDFQGNTTFNFTNIGGGMSLQPDILVADLNNAMPNPGTFSANGLPSGLVTYALVKNAVGDLVVRSSAIAAIGGIAGNVAVVQSTLGAIVNRPSSPFVSGLAVEVDPGYCGPGVWGRATGGAVNAGGTSTSTVGTSFSSTVGLKYAGAQFGMDLACFNLQESGIDVSVGAIAGYNTGAASQALGMGLGTTNSSFNQGYGGLYATVAKGQFSADVQARVDATRFTFNNSLISLNNATLDTIRTSLSTSASYALPFGEQQDMVLVPTAGFSASRTTSNALVFNANQTLQPLPSLSLVGFAGATVAKTFVQPDQVSAVQPFATATVYRDFAAFPVATFTDTGTGFSETVTSTHLGTIGEISVGTNFFRIFEGDPKQLNATVRIDTRFSSILLGAGVTAQLRAQF